jgi:hypothetical protein
MPTVTMALTQTQPKPKPAVKANATPKQKTQMHRRSRTGCYTCRLRRKKCDEGTPLCTACRHLGLSCEYKRPMWWSNSEARRKHKEDIKLIIKRKKLTEKSAHHVHVHGHPHAHMHPHHMHAGLQSPPPGMHPLPTPATTASMDGFHSHGFPFSSPPGPGVGAEFGSLNAQMHPDLVFGAFGASPYEIDVKTERQMYVNDVPTMRESTVSTFTTFQTPPPPGTVVDSAEWSHLHHQHATPHLGQQPQQQQQQHQQQQQQQGSHASPLQSFDEHLDSLSEEVLDLNFFDFAQVPTGQVALEIEEGDQHLLDHFIQFVMPTIFPILESNQHGSVASDLILPSLQSNRGYLHCCLSIAAQDIKARAAPGTPTDDMDQAIMRHRYETVSTLCDALNRDQDHQHILDAALGQIFMQCLVARADDSLPDIAWHKHFEAAISLVQKLDLPRAVADPANRPEHPPFNMTLASWIDILGATMLGRSPTFAHTYREKLVNSEISSLGLRELMGCDDRVMYLISEIACLDSLKKAGMDDMTLCHHVHTLGEQIGYTEAADPAPPRMPFNTNGTLSPRQLSRNLTAAFRLAARIYLCSLVPGFSPSQDSCVGLVERITQVLQFVPAGAHGFDRSLAWVYIMAGSVALPGSSFRALFEERVAQSGEQAEFGSLGRTTALLREVWVQSDAAAANAHMATGTAPSPAPSSPGKSEPAPYVHWRDVMLHNGWEFLLI